MSRYEHTQTLSVPATPDRSVKRERVRSILDRLNADAIELTSAAAVTWYLDGARIHVNLAGEPIVSVRVSRDRDQVFVTSNELSRLNREELPSDIELNVRHWYQDLTISDALPEREVEKELREARKSLLPYEVDRYRKLGSDAAEAMTQALSHSYAEMTERRLAATVAEQLIEKGADPLVLLVAGQARLDLRHPLPTDETLGRRALLVVCARRHGLIASASRWTTFGMNSAADRDAEVRIAQVEAAIFDATVPGAELGELLSVARRAYHDQGFGDEEWKAHHQGGPTGYATRDPRATPGSLERVAAGQAFAWNPSALGVKIEDTVIASADGVEVLTVDKAWPTAVVSGRARPVTLEL